MSHEDGIEEIITFWFSEPVKRTWFNSNPAFDRLLRVNYLELYQTAASGRLNSWMDSPRGCLALCILLDQFPLNMFRGDAASYEAGEAALVVAKHAVKLGYDRQLEDLEKSFIYIPYMHSESLDDQNTAIRLYENAGLGESLKWAHHHQNIIKRFGRFPHRNKALGRPDTPEEAEYLRSPDAFLG